MNQYTLFVLLAPFGLIVSISIAVYCWLRKNARGARPLGISMTAVALFLFFNTLELVTPDAGLTLFLAKLNYLFISALTIHWILFALEYTNHENWLPSRRYFLLWIIPLITVVLVFTNQYHHLIWKEYEFLPVGMGFLEMRVISYGSFFWIFWLQAYLCILGGAVIILWSALLPHQIYRKQSHWAIAGALFPLIFNLTYVLHLIPGFIKDYSSLTYAFSGIMMAISIFKYHMLDLTPFARSTLIDHMSDVMLTLDTEFRLADMNPSATRILNGQTKLEFNQRIPFFQSQIETLASQPEKEFYETEICMDGAVGTPEYYDLSIRRLKDQKADTIGYLVALHDITEHKRLLNVTNQLAMQDPLTGLLNRRSFSQQSDEVINYLKLTNEPSAVIMLDIDLFKQINDTLGHRSGDYALVDFGSYLRKFFRGADLIGRFGGDEFTIFLPNTTRENAYLLAKRLREQVEKADFFRIDPGKFHFTISIGVAQVDYYNGKGIEETIENADRCLYQAKNAGRNQVCMQEAV